MNYVENLLKLDGTKVNLGHLKTPLLVSPYWSGNNPHPCGLLHKYRVSEHIHYFTNTLEVLQQCNIFKFMA